MMTEDKRNRVRFTASLDRIEAQLRQELREAGEEAAMEAFDVLSLRYYLIRQLESASGDGELRRLRFALAGCARAYQSAFLEEPT